MIWTVPFEVFLPLYMSFPTRLTRPSGALFALCIVVSVLAVGCFGPSEEELSRDHYERGLQYEENGSYVRAREEYTQAIRRDRLFTDAYVAQGRVLFQTSNFRAAMAIVDEALRLDEGHVEAHNVRGLVSMYTGDSESAILSFTRAIELDPKYAEAYHNRAQVNVQDNNADSALEDLSRVIELEPFEPRYYVERARLYAFLDERDRALRDLERVLEVTQDEEYTTPARRMMENLRQAP